MGLSSKLSSTLGQGRHSSQHWLDHEDMLGDWLLREKA